MLGAWLGLAALLILFALSPDLPAQALHIRIIAIATFAGSVLVLYATKGRHPGWFGLLIAAGLAWLGQSGA